MIKLYFDWNVISGMRNGYLKDLKEIVYLKDRFFKPYSTSHIGDLLASLNSAQEQQDLIYDDLKFITELSDDWCLFNDGKDLVLEQYSPNDLLEQRLEDKDLFRDISLDGLSNLMPEDESVGNIGKKLFDLLRSMPLDSEFKKAFESPESRDQMNVLFPGLKDNLTMEGFFKSFSEMNRGLNEREDYKDLRRLVQAGLSLKRDKLFNSKDPFLLIDKEYQRFGVTGREHVDYKKNAPEWFNKLTHEYFFLDMHGYQEDKVNVRQGRKETFRNTTEDAFHAAFASTCHFYITNDKKTYNKTKQVYKRLGINTRVFKVEEFLQYYNQYLNLEDRSMNLKLALEFLKVGAFTEEQQEGSVIRTYMLPYFLFDFFNKIITRVSDDPDLNTILLSRDRPTNSKTYVFEIKKLVTEISLLLGQDDQNLGEVKQVEFEAEFWQGRTWSSNGMQFKLVCLNGYFQFYLDYI